MKLSNEINLHASEIIYELPRDTKRHFLYRKGDFIFSAYGCALTERQTPGGMYVYTAVNCKTGASETVSRRKNQLGTDGHDKMAAKIYTLSIRGDGSRTADKKPGEAARDDTLADTARHIFREILPLHGYAVRDRQIELAEHILGVIGKKGITLAESEVGTGKTHAYLVAAVLAKRGRLNDFWVRGSYPRQSWAESAHMPAVISTSSIALQKAIVTDYIPELSRILIKHDIIRTPLTVVIRKGKEHYICEKRLISFRGNTDERTRALLEPFIGSTAPFDLTGADSLTPYMKKRICVMEKCADSCRFYQYCRYIRFMKAANDPKVDFQITNHNYFLADTLHRVSGRKPLLPNYQLVVIDEAHKFLGAARQMYGLELTDRELPALAQEVHAITAGKSGGGVNVHRLAKKLEDQSAKLFQTLNDNIPEDADDEAERFSAVLDGTAGACISGLTGIIGKLAEALEDSRVSVIHAERQSKAVWQLDTAAERIASLGKPGRLIHWFEKRMEGETKTDALCGLPKDLDERLFNDLWSKAIPVVLTSGTLSASGDFRRIKETLGLDRKPVNRLFDTTMASPFDYINNKLLYISGSVPFPDNKDKRYIAAVAAEIERLVRASHGHAAVLFTSYNAMGQVHAILKNRSLPFPLFRLERGGVHAIERFKKSGNGILLASGALWEGIDIPGDTLSMLIIVKLPFAVPDPIGDYERSLCGDMEAYKTRVIIPDMQIKLKQGDGRLIRSETDTGVVAILDIRAGERGAYRDKALAALPGSRVTSDIQAVRDFYTDKKPAAYFLSQNTEVAV